MASNTDETLARGAINYATVALTLGIIAVIFSMVACFYVASYIEGTKELAQALNRIADMVEAQNRVKMGGK